MACVEKWCHSASVNYHLNATTLEMATSVAVSSYRTSLDRSNPKTATVNFEDPQSCLPANGLNSCSVSLELPKLPSVEKYPAAIL